MHIGGQGGGRVAFFLPCCWCLLRMRAKAKMIVKGGVCITGCDERELCVRTLPVLFKGSGDGRGDDCCNEVQRRLCRGNMLLRRKSRLIHNNCGALVNVLANWNSRGIPQSRGVPVGTKYGKAHSAHCRECW
jgi:hypothetical protein